MSGTVSEKGQVVIPKAIRKALGIRPGSQVKFELAGDEARMKVARAATALAEEGLGMLKYRGPRCAIDKLSGVEAARRLARKGRLR